MDSDVAIEVKNVSKTFKIHHEKKTSVYEYLTSLFNRNNSFEDLTVLKNLSFSVKKGEMLGIIGLNGSGKTTLLKIIGKIYTSDKGYVETKGRLTPFLGLGTGFNGEFTARDNIILYGVILGFTKKEIEKKINDIVRFAELENFLDTKLKNFSSGMNARLAFATAIQADPDIMLIDEILSVGDLPFREKSFNTFMEFKKKNKTIILVSHSLNQIETLCDKALLIHKGRMRAFGNPREVIDTYKKIIGKTPDNEIINLKPWFHDFSKLGVNTAINGLSVTMKNQMDKEPIIMNFLSKSFSEIKIKNPSFLELFSSDGYYSISVLENFTPGKMVAIDKDKKMVQRARTMLKKLNLPSIEFRTEDISSSNFSEKFDIVLNAGGLHHVENPQRILEMTFNLSKKYAIIQSVVTMETEDGDYFVTPAPDWTWGCRFTDARLRKWIKELGWKIIDYQRNTLRANKQLKDKSSVYYLCEKT